MRAGIVIIDPIIRRRDRQRTVNRIICRRRRNIHKVLSWFQVCKVVNPASGSVHFFQWRIRSRNFSNFEQLDFHAVNDGFRAINQSVIIRVVPDEVAKVDRNIQPGIPGGIRFAGDEFRDNRFSGDRIRVAVFVIAANIRRRNFMRGRRHEFDIVLAGNQRTK